MKTKSRKTPCIICGKGVTQDKSTSVDRQTCARKMVAGRAEKSVCEKEKARRYQETYRKNNPTAGSPKTVMDRSVALSSVNHLAKHKAKKYKRNCLKCLGEFEGIGRFNRICNSCSIENSRQSNLKGGA